MSQALKILHVVYVVAQYRFTEATYTVRENEGPAQLAIELFSDTVLTFPATVRVTDIQGGTATGRDETTCFSMAVNVVAVKQISHACILRLSFKL